jgi:hypothetical protein
LADLIAISVRAIGLFGHALGVFLAGVQSCTPKYTPELPWMSADVNGG